MDNKQFKTIFNKLASSRGLCYNHSAWFKESEESIIVLSLQKSNYSDIFCLNIKTYIKGVFGKNYSISKELVKDTGNIFRREPKDFENAFNLENELSELEREREINNMFEIFLIPYSNIMLQRKQIVEQFHKGSKDFFLLPAVQKELGISLNNL